MMRTGTERPSRTHSLRTTRYSLPELGARRGEVGEVGDVGGDPEAFVLADGVLHAVRGVPAVSAAGPGQLVLETLQQVVQTPRQDHDVVDVQQRHDHDRSVADS